MTGDWLLRSLPRLALGLLTLPMAAGLLVSLLPAFNGGFAALSAWPGLWPAAALSAFTGLGSTIIALGITALILAMLHDRPAFQALRRLLSPLLAVPHAAAALGLAFVIAPSGWIARLLSPWATGWQRPPDLLTLNDPWGLALMVGLVAKELPFLLLMALAALPASSPAGRLAVTAALGHGRLSGFGVAVWPTLYAQLRLPVMAVLTYAMTTVEMGQILGPGLPPTLAVQIAEWMTDPGLRHLSMAAAAAVVQLALVVMVMGLWRVGERAGHRLLAAYLYRGQRGRAADTPARALALVGGFGLVGLLGLSLAGLALWSVTGVWTFPAAVPQVFGLHTWRQATASLAPDVATTLIIALGATMLAILLVIACLEAERRHGLRPGHWANLALYLPLLLPQIAVLPGLQVIALRLGVDGTIIAVTGVHLVYLLPYVFLSLAPAFRGWNPALGRAAASLGASERRIFWRIRLPMLLAPVLTALALGVAVSAGQYLPTLLIGGGRVTTLTTEAVALSSGGNRRLVGVWALAQLLLPAAFFALALALPRLVFAKRRALLAGTRT